MKINRRMFTTGGAAALAGTVWRTDALASGMKGTAGASETLLTSGWQVLLNGKVIEADVSLPHTPVALSWRRWEPAAWEKVWTYRRTFHVERSGNQRRLFLHVGRALANSAVLINGQEVARHQGGFTPFDCELTHAVHPGANELVIQVDGRWLDVPPSGSPRGFAAVDYYLPAGVTGEVSLRDCGEAMLRDVWSRSKDIAGNQPSLDVFAEVDTKGTGTGRLVARLLRGDALVAKADARVRLSPGTQTLQLQMASLSGIELWSPETPQLYRLEVSLQVEERLADTRSVRIGFREATFELDGFYLNGKKTRLFGLNRHELFPYVGFAASPRAMRHDAAYLRNVLNCNVVRCSHYPQSTAFLDACDELGLMVWEEIPGWQYLGDVAWKDVAVQNTAEMIRRDRNHPSIIIWGTRVNESANDPELYRRTLDVARQLDPTRPTSGSMTPSSRSDWKEHWHQDIFAFDDYHAAPDGSVGIDSALPGIPYMLSEAVGQFSYGSAKNFLRRYRRAGLPEEQNTQAVLHAQAHDRAAQDERNAGVIAWCGFDYASPMNAYDGVKCPGVLDTFRIPKLGASFYRSQVNPEKKIIIEPSFYWDAKLRVALGNAAIFSNCEELHIFLDNTLHTVARAAWKNYPKLAYPPFFADLPWNKTQRSVLRIDGYIARKLRLSRSFDPDHSHDQLWARSDDAFIGADGVDSTRIAFGVADHFGNLRPGAEGTITVQHTGAGVLIGDTEFPLEETGAVGAVWLRSVAGLRGTATVTVSHPSCGSRSAIIKVS